MALRRAWLAASFGLIAAVGGVRAQAPDAASVLAKAREALGGEKTLAAVRTIVIEGETRQVRGDNLVPIVFQTNIELPDKYSRRDETPATESGYSTSGFSGDALIQLPQPVAMPQMPMAARPGGPPPPTPEQLAAQQTAQRKTRVVSLKQDFTRLMLGMFAAAQPAYPLTFTRLGVAESPQGKADVIEARGPDNFVARLLINQDTHLPVMLSWSPPAGRAGGATPPENRIFYADYRDVDGIQLPFRFRRAVGADTVEETTVDRYKLNAKIDPKKFEVIK